MKKLTGGGALGAVGTVRSFMNVVRDIDFDEVRQRAEEMPRLLVVGADQQSADTAAREVFGDGGAGSVTTRVWSDGSSLDASSYDAIIVTDPSGSGLLEKVRKAVGSGNRDAVFYLSASGKDPVEMLRLEVVEKLPVLAPAMGRHFEPWRVAAVRAIIDETAKANAQFALVSNIPAVVPLLGGLVAASADLLVLTKNQVMMAYKIAAAHDRDLESQMAIIRELTPVVGAGLVWRTVAREAAAFIPFAAGTIPKVAIAFAGTMTVGRAADYFYRFGSKPSKSQMEQFMDTAVRLTEKLPFIGPDSPEERLENEKELTAGVNGQDETTRLNA
jgi:uncharacterized protein (DUF697 family)